MSYQALPYWVTKDYAGLHPTPNKSLIIKGFLVEKKQRKRFTLFYQLIFNCFF